MSEHRLPRVLLGDGLEVSAQGFGCMALSDAYGPTDPAEAEATLHAAIDLGVTFLDTADVYGEAPPGRVGPAGTNEELVGRVLRTRRAEVQVATKFGITGADPSGTAGPATRGDKQYAVQACDASLRRLGVDVIDLYYLHRRDLRRPVEETVEGMAGLVTQGKVRHLGVCELTAGEVRAAAAVHPIAAIQSEWSVWSRDVEANVVPTAAELGVGFVPYSPLGRGFLTGALTRERVAEGMLSDQPRFTEHFDANQALVDVVVAVAAEHDATAAQVALAWLHHRSETFGLPVVPIPGTRRATRIAENAAATGVLLTPAQVERLDAASAYVVGSRNLTFFGEEWISQGRE